MIARLTGQPAVVGSLLVLTVGGVGYEVQAGSGTLAALQTKQQATVEICTLFKQESLQLYGFTTLEEKQLFMLLLSVSGVGPRTALAVVDKSVAATITAVQQADVQFFTSIPRLGKKNAQKIIIELKSKLGDELELHLGDSRLMSSEPAQALLALGYDEQSIAKALQAVPLDTLSSQEAVKEALRLLAK